MFSLIKDKSQRKKILIFAGILILMISYFVVSGMEIMDQSVKVEPKPKISNQASAKVNEPQEIQSVNPEVAVDIAQIYPFVIPGEEKGPSGNISSNVNIRPSEKVPLPVIPSYQPGNLNKNNIPMPEIPYLYDQKNRQTAPTAKVSGVLVGQDGKNMAIMGDGKIVQEGDSYNGSEISRISNDGIHFENGNTISYGIK